MKLYNLRKNFIIWSIVTIICAAPSFVIAYDSKFNISAMLLGIFIVIIGYTFITSTAFIKNIKDNKKYFAKALKVGFVLKIIQSIVGGIASLIKIDIGMQFSIIDFYAGLFSVFAMEWVFGVKAGTDKSDFLTTLVITLTEAFIMSVFILLVSCVIWGLIRLWMLIFNSDCHCEER